MEGKTRISAEEGKQEIIITREFDLPVDLLFRAYTEAEFVEQWMGTRVLKLESRKHGSWSFETSDRKGNVLLRSHGVIHDLVAGQHITRTFEMENTPFPVQLEFLEFTALGEASSRLHMHVVYKSVAHRDQMLKLPFAQGINMAHKKLEEVMIKLKPTL